MSAPCPTRSHSIKCVFSGSTQESASFVPRDRFFSERMEESPQIITLNYILIAADFPAQLRIFTLQFCRTELSVDRLMGELHLPPGVFGPVLIPHMVLVQQPAGFNVQVFGEGICRHACIHRFRKLGRAACPFSAFGGNKLGNRKPSEVPKIPGVILQKAKK